MLGMTAVGALLLIYLMYQPAPSATPTPEEPENEPPPPPRNFTIDQLHVRIVQRTEELCLRYFARYWCRLRLSIICVRLREGAGVAEHLLLL